jgi:hypothetical protein
MWIARVQFALLTCCAGLGSLRAQSLTVIIDTVRSQDLLFSVELDPGWWAGGPLVAQVEPAEETFDTQVYPNYTARFDSLPPSAVLLIPLDQDGGRVMIKGIQEYVGDTLLLGSVTVLRRCVRDTTRGTTLWYPVGDTALGPLLKAEPYTRLHKRPDCAHIPKELALRIQGRVHRVPLVLRDLPEFTVGHGYKPSKCGLDDKYRHRGKCRYFHFNDELHQWLYSATIDLSQGAW